MCMGRHAYGRYTWAYGCMSAQVYRVGFVWDNNSYAWVQCVGMARVQASVKDIW